MSDINRVTLIGRLTRDPEVRYTSGGMPIVNMGLASNTRTKANGEWIDKVNFFDVKFFGDRFEKAASHLEKGRRIAIDGRLEWSTWTVGDQKRSKIEIVGNEIQFLDSNRENVEQDQVDSEETAPVGSEEEPIPSPF